MEERRELSFEKFPLIELKGTHAEIGFQHGLKLKNRIEKAIEFYKDVTKKLNHQERETRMKRKFSTMHLIFGT